MRKIQASAVSRAVILLGVRWASSLHRAQVGPIVQNIVVTSLGGVTTTKRYNELKMASVKGDFHLLQQIQQTQNKTAKQRHNMIRELIVFLFKETNDAMINYKVNLFNVAKPQQKHSWGPIVSPYHELLQEMMALPAPVINGEHPTLPRTCSP